MTERNRQKERTRHALIQAGIALILEQGYKATSIGDITNRAGYGRGTFYLHFDNKEEFVWEVLQDYYQDIDSRIDAQVSTLPIKHRAYLSWMLLFENAREMAIFFMQIQGEAANSLRERQRIAMIAMYEGHLRAGNYTADTDVPPEVAARFLVGATLQLLDWWVLDQPDYTPHDMAAMLYRLFYRESPPKLESPPILDSSSDDLDDFLIGFA